MSTIAELIGNPVVEQEASNTMLLWQYRKLMGQFLLAQEHSTDLSCPCELSSEYEYCLPNSRGGLTTSVEHMRKQGLKRSAPILI